MADELLPPPIGENPLPPSSLSPEQQELCERLDELHNQCKLEVKPSDMFRGAIFAIRTECQSNPDRIAQAAHSLREILYPFDNKGKAFEKYGSVHADQTSIQDIGTVYGHLTKLAHHNASADLGFQNLLARFVHVMLHALTRQIDVHEKIDQILSGDPTQVISDDPTTQP